MAISAKEYLFLSILHQTQRLPDQPTVLEVGEQHWHGDVSVATLAQDLDQTSADPDQRAALHQALEQALQQDAQRVNFDIAKVAYRLYLNYKAIAAIDLHGTEDALQFDLNYPVSLDRTFDITINFGTGEHVFNVAQFFKTLHDLTRPGGIMLHTMPFLGWIDHGFYTFQPTFYWDLAASNRYEMVLFLIQAGEQMIELHRPEDLKEVLTLLLQDDGRLPTNASIYAALQKNEEPQDFCIPRQGYFTVSAADYWAMIHQVAPAALPTHAQSSDLQ